MILPACVQVTVIKITRKHKIIQDSFSFILEKSKNQ